MTDASDETAVIERAYHRALWTIVGHAVFVAACCAAVILLRRMVRLPPALLGVVFIVALIVFGGDIMKFLRARDRRRRADSRS